MKLSKNKIFKHLKNSNVLFEFIQGSDTSNKLKYAPSGRLISNLHWYKKIILLAILLFGSFFCVWILNIFGLYDYNQNIDFESFRPYSVNE
jgi:hypothetical protein